MAYCRLEPWNDDSLGPWGSIYPDVNGKAGARWVFKNQPGALHIGHPELFMAAPDLRDLWQEGDAASIPGPSNEDIVKGAVAGMFNLGNLLGRLEPRLRYFRDRGVVDGFPIYADMEEFPDYTPGSRLKFPGLWDLYELVTPGLTDLQRQSKMMAAGRATLQVAVEMCGLNSEMVVAFGCAKAKQYWNNQDATPDFSGISHIISTNQEQAATDALEANLVACGPEETLVHLNSMVDPEQNRQRLAICRRLGVPNVILFGEDAASLSTQVPVFAEAA